MLSLTWYACSASKYPDHMINDISSSIPTSSTSVEIFVFNLCLFEFDLESPWPMVIIIPVRLFMSQCTPNAVSTYQHRVFVSSIPSMRGIPMVDRMYLMNWVDFLQSYFYGSFTLVQRKAKTNYRSGMAFLAGYNRFSVTWWNIMVYSLLSFYGLYLVVVNRWYPYSFAAYYVFMPLWRS